jgi:hypothetical protein
VTVATNDLISFDEALVWFDDGGAKRDLAEAVITGSSAIIENYLHRVLVTRGTITEYHWLEHSSHELYLSRYPIIAVTSVHEDSARGYGAAYLLTSGTDFIAVNDDGKLIRTSSATTGQRNWLMAFEGTKIIYTAGYAATATIPETIKDVCKRLAREVYVEITKNLAGMTGTSDAMGTISRIGPAMLTSGMKHDLANYRKLEFGKTWTRVSVSAV